ncbi:12758_t:CDS:10, partial [Entrophospora sp. SA101]
LFISELLVYSSNSNNDDINGKDPINSNTSQKLFPIISTTNDLKDQEKVKIAGSASSLFNDSSEQSPFDSLFAADQSLPNNTNNNSNSNQVSQNNVSVETSFDELSITNEHPSTNYYYNQFDNSLQYNAYNANDLYYDVVRPANDENYPTSSQANGSIENSENQINIINNTILHLTVLLTLIITAKIMTPTITDVGANVGTNADTNVGTYIDANFGTNVDANFGNTTKTQSPAPPPSISPISSVSTVSTNLVPCIHPHCEGENKPTAKFCSECGQPINKVNTNRLSYPVTAAKNDSETSNINNDPYYNGINAHARQSLPSLLYNQHQASFSTSSFASYSNYPSSPIIDYYNKNANSFVDKNQLLYHQKYNADSFNSLNDPLGRSKGCPVVAFGFGGKVFTMFPRTVQRFTGTDQNIAIAKFAPSEFTIRTLKHFIFTSDIDEFPGPLLMDNNKGGVKAKKKQLNKYLGDKIISLQDSVMKFSGEEIEKKKLESTLVIWQLLKSLFENDGVIIGNPKIDETIRKILVPNIFVSENDESHFTVPASGSFDSSQGLSQTPATTSLSYTTSSKSIDELQNLLLKGDRIAAIRLAMDENLWSHALIIASCVNKDTWKDVVNGFIRHEMGGQMGDAFQSNGRESLRVLYSLFAGNGPNAVKEFFPQRTLLNQACYSPVNPVYSQTSNSSQFNLSLNTPYVVAPVTPAFSPAPINEMQLERLIKWRETLAMIIANRSPGDSQAISALGDLLKEHGWVHASHICYILSPKSSINSGIDTPNTRFTLVGKDYLCSNSIDYFHDWEALRLTEIYEFGISLTGNEGGLPFLQAYKLIYAWWLVDCGHLNEARRYCESIANIVKVYTKGSPYFHGCFLQKLKDLTQRLLEHGGSNSGTNESSSWTFAKKMPKASLDSLWESLEGKFNKFVAGDSVDKSDKKTPSTNFEPVGPFSHYSAITQPIPSRSTSADSYGGLSNNAFGSKKKQKEIPETSTEDKQDENVVENVKADEKQNESQDNKKEESKLSWFGKFFTKKENGKVANLGEEISFYYDPVQKRWVNKKGGMESSTLTPPPPPPPPTRAKTTSPTPSASMAVSNNNSNNNKNSTSSDSLIGPPPGINPKNISTTTTPPPLSIGSRRSASSTSNRRPVRARYVDIMNQIPPSN